MEPDFAQQPAHLRASFVEMRGEPFQRFFCPMLFTDENVPLCRAHIVNRAFANASRRWTIQRADVDNFFGSLVEADFVDLQRNQDGIAERALVNGVLNKRFRPSILVDGKSVDYFVPTGIVPKDYSDVLFDIGGKQKRLALKIPAAELESSAGSWEIEVAKDVRLQSVVSVIKAAHLTLFALFGYRYALSPAGAFVGHLLGDFFSASSSLARQDILTNARKHFGSVAAMVRPIASQNPELAGTIDDGYARMCWLGTSSTDRAWALIVFVRTGQSLHAALTPMFDDIAGERRFVQLLDSGEGDLVIWCDSAGTIGRAIRSGTCSIGRELTSPALDPA